CYDEYLAGRSRGLSMPIDAPNDPRPRKLRILLLAELCHPQWASVPLLAYSLAKELSRRDDLDVTLVSQIRSRDALLADSIADLAKLHFINSEFVAWPMGRLSTILRGGTQLSYTTSTAFAWPGYIAFDKMVHRRFGADLRAHSFDLIHRISPVTPTVGS